MVSVSTDDALLDVERIHRWLSEDAYWARGRSRETVERSLRHSVNVGAYDDGELVGRVGPAGRRSALARRCGGPASAAVRTMVALELRSAGRGPRRPPAVGVPVDLAQRAVRR